MDLEMMPPANAGSNFTMNRFFLLQQALFRIRDRNFMPSDKYPFGNAWLKETPGCYEQSPKRTVIWHCFAFAYRRACLKRLKPGVDFR
jgi:hypothetical protein